MNNRNRKESLVNKRKKREKAGSSIRYQLKAAYLGNKRIYTVLDVSANSTLDDLCDMILDAFDFTHEHLYLFNLGGRGYGSGKDVYLDMPDPGENGTNVKLGKLNLVPKQKFYFLYDFGDDWEFEIQVQKIYETNEHVINGIVSVKGELEQYPDCDEEDWDGEDWDEEEGTVLGGKTWKEMEEFLDNMDDEDWEKIMGVLEEKAPEILETLERPVFQIDPDASVRWILDTLEEKDLRLCAAAFLAQDQDSDELAGKNIDWISGRYASALLEDRERMLLFQRGITSEVFRFLMTAEIDPKTGQLDLNNLWQMEPLQNGVYAQEVYESFLYLYTMGVCAPAMGGKGKLMTFSVSKEMRDAYEGWMNQPDTVQKQRFYGGIEELSTILLTRYGVIEMERLHEICQKIVGREIPKEDFAYLINSRLCYFGRYNSHVFAEDKTEYISAFEAADVDMVLRERKKYAGMDYRPIEQKDCEKCMKEGPLWDVDGYNELVEALWDSLQDIHSMSVIVQKVTDMSILGRDAESVIKEVRSLLNASGKRMTKKFWGLIQRIVNTMPLATRYGYKAGEMNS